MAPQRHIDPFATNPEKLNPKINPYVETLVRASETGDLPLAFGDGLRGAAGRWRERLTSFYATSAAGDAALPERLVVEIGCHKGNTLIEMAKRHPDYGFIGIDITYKRVVTTAERARAAGLRNVYCVLANAVALDQIFAPSEVDGLVIFFPDPWVKKKRQAKNRLVGSEFAGRAATVLRPGGFLWFKTDQLPYFEAGGESIGANGLLPGADSVREPLLAYDFSSTFEKRFREQNLPTFGAVWRRPDVLA